MEDSHKCGNESSAEGVFGNRWTSTAADQYNDDDEYSPTSWERDYGESDESYAERIEDQESLVDYYN